MPHMLPVLTYDDEDVVETDTADLAKHPVDAPMTTTVILTASVAAEYAQASDALTAVMLTTADGDNDH
jgi:hypothetical protein